jgi:hypothetical protein
LNLAKVAEGLGITLFRTAFGTGEEDGGNPNGPNVPDYNNEPFHPTALSRLPAFYRGVSPQTSIIS